MAERLAPEDLPSTLAEWSSDVRVAVLVDGEGALVASSETDPARAQSLAELTVELMETADAAAEGRAAQVEAQVDGGAVFATRESGYTLAVVARRLALASLVLYDMRTLLGRLETA